MKLLFLLCVVLVAVYIIWTNWRGERVAEQLLSELRQRGLPTSISEVREQQPALDAARNGARFYRAAFALGGLSEAEFDGIPHLSMAEDPEFGVAVDGETLDPYGDGPLEYMQTQEGCTVYSVGSDGKDDGGRPGSRPTRDGDLVFRLLDTDRRNQAPADAGASAD